MLRRICCYICLKKWGNRQSFAKYTAEAAPFPPRISSDLFMVVAIFDFVNSQEDELPFQRGDRMYILDNENSNWWTARHAENGDVGLIPSTFVRRLEPYPENHEAWNVVNRHDAISLLSNYGPGIFLIRPYIREDAYCTISITCPDGDNSVIVKHFKVFMEHDGTFRFCSKSSDKNFFHLINQHMTPSACDCGIELKKHCVEQPNMIPRQLLIPKDAFTMIEKFDGGHFGDVWRGTMQSQEVAIKQLKGDDSQSIQFLQEFLEEAKLLVMCKHRYVVKLLGVCTENGPLQLIMEYVALGPLNKFLNTKVGLKITFTRLCMMMENIADGMDYISTTMNIVHRDLRAANILVDKNHCVKISDFGLARDAEYVPSNFKLPIRWTAPEAFSSGGHSTKADVWSFGVLVYEMLTYGTLPYADMSKAEVKEAVQEGYRLPNPRGRRLHGGLKIVECPDSVYETMKHCWEEDPQQRPTFAYLKSFFYDTVGMYDPEYLEADVIGSHQSDQINESP